MREIRKQQVFRMNTSVLRIGIAGITGRVGRLLMEEITSRDNAVLSGGTSLSKDIHDIPDSVQIFSDIASLVEKSDVIIDFTNATATETHAKALNNSKTAWILGTTGISESVQKLIKETAKTIPIVQAANF